MPKMKTKKAISGRFKITASGQMKRNRPNRRHIMTKKSSKRKRQLRRPGLIDECHLPVYRHLVQG